MPDSSEDVTEYEACLTILNILLEKENVNQTRINNITKRVFYVCTGNIKSNMELESINNTMKYG